MSKAATTNDYQKYFIRFTNRIKPGQELSLRCISQDHDYGVKKVPFETSWSFLFFSNIEGTAKFYCSFEWPEAGGAKWFDIFKTKEDYRKCETLFLGCTCQQHLWNSQ
ncbi:hypothetical protein SLE2022_162170 [Rubroshorea leprosula]